MPARTMHLVLILAALGLVLGACSSTSGGSHGAAAAAAEGAAPQAPGSAALTDVMAGADLAAARRSEPPGLGRVQFQDHVVTIHGGGADGPQYTLETREGGLIAASMTRDQFQARYPEIFETFESAEAKRLDASHHIDTGGERGAPPR